MNNFVQRSDRKFVRLGLQWLVALLVLCAFIFGQIVPVLRRIHEASNQQRGRDESLKLLRAAKEGNREAARMAIFAGADVNCSPSGETPLGHAIVGRNMQLISILLESSADPDGIFRQEIAPMGTGTPLTYAVQKNDIAVARVLLDAGADAGSGLPGPFPLLQWCIEKDYLKMLDLLIEHGASIEADGRAAMDFAVRLGKSAAGDLLARHGASYTVREAVAFNRLDDVKKMVEESPALFQERFTPGDLAHPEGATTLLGVALRLGHREMAEFLIESGAPVDVLECEGSTLLHAAAVGGDAELVKCLIARNLDINALDNSRETPLHEAVRRDHPEVVKVLIAAGADIDIRETVLQLAINVAIDTNSSDVVRLLLEAGADTSSEKLRTLLETKLERKPNNERLFKVFEEFGLVQ